MTFVYCCEEEEDLCCLKKGNFCSVPFRSFLPFYHKQTSLGCVKGKMQKKFCFYVTGQHGWLCRTRTKEQSKALILWNKLKLFFLYKLCQKMRKSDVIIQVLDKWANKGAFNWIDLQRRSSLCARGTSNNW